MIFRWVFWTPWLCRKSPGRNSLVWNWLNRKIVQSFHNRLRVDWIIFFQRSVWSSAVWCFLGYCSALTKVLKITWFPELSFLRCQTRIFQIRQVHHRFCPVLLNWSYLQIYVAISSGFRIFEILTDTYLNIWLVLVQVTYSLGLSPLLKSDTRI